MDGHRGRSRPQLHVFARDDDYFFGVLHSRVHEVWFLAQCSWMGVGNDPSYSSSRTFGTFPVPWPPGQELLADPRVEAIAIASRELVEQQGRWLNPPDASAADLQARTLTNLYNQRPTWLDLAHKKLDEAVFAAYGWNPGISDDELLGKLLDLNQQRAGLDVSSLDELDYSEIAGESLVSFDTITVHRAPSGSPRRSGRRRLEAVQATASQPE